MKIYRCILAFMSIILLGPNLGLSRERNYSIEKLKDSLGSQRSKISNLRSSINSLEKKLGKENIRIIKNTQERKKYEDALKDTDTLLDESKETLARKIESLDSVIKKIMMSEAFNEDGFEDQLQQKKLKTFLNYKLDEYNKLQIGLNDLQTKFDKLVAKLQEYENIEAQLAQLILSLEEKKQGLASEYMLEIDRKEKIEETLERSLHQVVKRKAEKRSHNLVLPMTGYKNIFKKKNGLSIKFKGSRPVKASGVGRVIYSGSLANLGHVILIDHGKNIKSVILGRFSPKVSQSAVLKKGQIIGYTKTNSDEIYFEIRKNDKPLNIDKNLSTII